MKKYIFIVLAVFGSVIFASHAFADTQEWAADGSTVHLYHFNQFNPPTTANDEVGTFNWPIGDSQFRDGYISNGLHANGGSGTNVLSPTASDIFAGNTIVFSVFFSTTGSYERLLDWSTASTGGSPNGSHTYIQRSDTDHIQICNTSSCASLPSAYPVGSWHHFVVLADGSGGTIYSSLGESVGVGSHGTLEACTKSVLAGGGCDSTNVEPDTYDEFFIQGGHWSPAQITNYFGNYVAGIGNIPSFDTVITGAIDLVEPEQSSTVPNFPLWLTSSTQSAIDTAPMIVFVDFATSTAALDLERNSTNGHYFSADYNFLPTNPATSTKDGVPFDLYGGISTRIEFPATTSTVYYARASLYRSQTIDLSLFTGSSIAPAQLVATSPLISFTVDTTGSFASSTIKNGLTTALGSSTVNNAQNNLVNYNANIDKNNAIVSGLCGGGDNGIIPSMKTIICSLKAGFLDIIDLAKTAAQNSVNFVWGQTKQIFPLREIATINDAITLVQGQSTSTDHSIILTGQDSGTLSHAKLLGGSKHKYDFYSSSSIAWVNNKVHFDTRGLFTKAMYAITGLIILFTSLAAVVFMKHHSQNSPS